MNKEKIVVILLLITIILSIASIVVTFNLNTSNFFSLQAHQQGREVNTGNVNLVIEQPKGEVNQ